MDNWSNHKTYEWPGHRKLSWNKEDMSDENLLVCPVKWYLLLFLTQ